MGLISLIDLQTIGMMRSNELNFLICPHVFFLSEVSLVSLRFLDLEQGLELVPRVVKESCGSEMR